ncbi:hypothetical protein [Nocardioides zeae]
MIDLHQLRVAMRSGRAVRQQILPTWLDRSVLESDLYAERLLSASTLRTALLASEDESDPRGMVLRGVVITGRLDLRNARIKVPLTVIGSHFLDDVILEDASMQRVTFSTERSPSVFHGSLNAAGCSIESRLGMAGAVFKKSVRLTRASVDREINLTGVRVLGDRGVGIAANGLEVKGDLSIAGADVRGSVALANTKVGGDLIIDEARISAPGVSALAIDAARVGSVISMCWSRVRGTTSMIGAVVEGQLLAEGACLTEPDADGVSFLGDGLRVFADVAMVDLYSEGEVRLPGSIIEGQLSLRGAVLSGIPDSLAADGLRVHDLFSLADVSTRGALRLMNADVGGQVDLSGAFLSPVGGKAVMADSLKVKMDLFGERMFSSASLRFDGISVGGSIYLGGTFWSQDAPRSTAIRKMVVLRNGLVGGDLRFDSMHSNGEVSVAGARVVGSLSCADMNCATFNAKRLKIDGILSMPSAICGPVSLRNADIAHLQTQLSISGQAPRLESVLGWKLGTISGPGVRDPRAVDRWLKTATIPTSANGGQPWEEVARFYERSGQPADGRWLRYRSSVRSGSTGPRSARAQRSLYRWTCGNGHYPWFASIWIAIVFLFGLAVANSHASEFTTAATPGIRAEQLSSVGLSGKDPFSSPTAGRPRADQWSDRWEVPAFNPTQYAATVAIPVMDVYGSQAWTPPEGSVTIVFGLLRASAWVLTALLLAGVTGVLRRSI